MDTARPSFAARLVLPARCTPLAPPFTSLVAAALIAIPAAAQSGAEQHCIPGFHGASIHATGSALLEAESSLSLSATGTLAGSVGFFGYSPLRTPPVPFGLGMVCLGSPIGRLGPVATDAGDLSMHVPVLALAANAGVSAGSGWSFQFIFRSGANLDTTDAVEVQFGVSFPVLVFGTVEQGTRSDHPLSTAQEGGALVIDDAAAWSEFWDFHKAHEFPAPPIPDIDFDTHTVIAAFAGARPSSGYSLAIERVHRSLTTAVLRTRETQPGHGCVGLAIITQPFHLVVVPRVDGLQLGASKQIVEAIDCG